MAFSIGSQITATDFYNLKARVKNEMLRRDGYGSITGYGGAAYDYSAVPASGVVIRKEHYDKIRDVQANINTSGLPGPKSVGNLIAELVTCEAKQTLFESQPRGATSNNDCAAYCTGVCVSQCTSCSSCTGCTNGCTGGCQGCTSCQGCSGSCTGGCQGCTGGCTGCTGYCKDNCYSYCQGCNGCYGCSGCRTGCSGCNSGCTTGCMTDCGSCNTSCGGCQGCSGISFN